MQLDDVDDRVWSAHLYTVLLGPVDVRDYIIRA